MSKVFRRPMFRGGSTNMNGIMSGIEDRENYAEGSRRERLAKIAAEYPSTAIDPLSQFLIQGGLNLVSQPSTGGVLSDIATAAKGPTADLFSGLAKQGQVNKKLALEGEILDIEAEDAMALAKIKQKTAASQFQKDFTPDRKYYELMKDRTNSAAELESFEKPNIEQKFPRGTAKFDAYYSSDLLQSENPVAKEIRSSFENFVPYDSKKRRLVYEDMIPGMYYYDPKKNLYITNVPPSEDEEGGYYVVSPTTYEKRKLNP